MESLKDELLKAIKEPLDQVSIYIHRDSWADPEDYQLTTIDDLPMEDANDYEVIAYSPTYTYIQVIYDRYLLAFHRIPNNPSYLTKDDHVMVQAG